MDKEMMPRPQIAVFKGKQIRKAIHNDEWYFSIIDIVEALTESANPKRYWTDLKRKLTENEGFTQLYDKIVRLKLVAQDGKMRETEVANTDTRVTSDLSTSLSKLLFTEIKAIGARVHSHVGCLPFYGIMYVLVEHAPKASVVAPTFALTPVLHESD